MLKEQRNNHDHPPGAADPMTLWFDRPAELFHEACPLGNGRLGALDFGGTATLRIALNESSVWSGGPYDGNRYSAHECLPGVRERLFAGDIAGAQAEIERRFGNAIGAADVVPPYRGCYQTLGDLTIVCAAAEAAPSGYRRELDLMSGIATTRYTFAGTAFTRQLVASKPDEVIALRIRADRPGAVTFTAALSRKENAAVAPDGSFLRMQGQLPFNSPAGVPGGGVRYVALLGVSALGGTIALGEGGWSVTGADEAILMVSAGTDLFQEGSAALVRQRLEKALARPFDAILADAAADHGSYMDRCAISLPAGPQTHLPTPARLRAAITAPDPALAALYFQFGRYLMVSGSRPDSQLPTNLQGIWAEEYDTPWRGDFHSNINVQMNYWPAEVTNLSDCHLPLMRFIREVAREGRKTAQAYYNAPGWMANHSLNPWGDTAPVYQPACVGPTCGAWLAQHIATHFAFTLDKAFLQEFYPIMRGASEFCQAVLVEDPKTGLLVTAPSNSPENRYLYRDGNGEKKPLYVCVGATYDLQIIRDLFLRTAEAARLLGVDAEFAKELDATRARLMPTRVNAAGRIMEWQEDFEEADVHHRHASHLWGLFPGTEISPQTPELFAGARRSLERRGDASTGWSMAWKMLFWARLGDGDRANRLLSDLLRPATASDINYRGEGGGSYANLFCAHPPFMIDGNFGGCAAIAEMLIQSHELAPDGGPIIRLLPALPSTWPEGSARGLRARGAFEFGLEWENGRLTRATILAQRGGTVTVRHAGASATYTLRAGETTTWIPEGP